MVFSFFKFNWKKSSAHLYLLTQFISANSENDMEFEKYRPIQDRLFESDFDREVKKLLENKE